MTGRSPDVVERHGLALALLLVLLLALPGLAFAQCEPALTGGGGPAARWEAVPDPSAAGGAALTEATRLRVADRYPLCILPAPPATDLDVTLRFKPIDGKLDRAGGIAVRLLDPNTYYVLRANAAEDNLRLYHVTRGRRVQFAGRENIKVALNTWHSLRLWIRGDQFKAWLDDALLIEAQDGRIAGPGRIALWSIADSNTLFEAPRIVVMQ